MNETSKLANGAFSVTNAAGVSPTQTKGSVPLGLSKQGKPVFGNQKLMQLNAPRAGEGTVKGMQAMVAPTGAFSDADHKSLNDVAQKAGDPQAISDLTDASNKEDSQPFVDKLHSHFGVDPTDQSKLSAANLAHTFTKMSPAQKSLGMAAFALQNHILPGGENTYNKTVIPETDKIPGVNTGQFLGLMTKGVNAYPLVGKFPQHATLSTLAGGDKSLDDVASYAHTNNMLGQGIDGKEVPLTPQSKQVLSSQFRSAPQFGPGAVVGADATKLPPGYENAGKVGSSIIGSPKGTVAMAQGALQSGLVGTNAGENGVSSSAANLYKNWKPTDNKDIQGKDGGSALSAGLIGLAKTSPFTFSANVGASLLKNQDKIPTDSADYVSNLGGITLARLEKGNTDPDTDAEGVKTAKSISSAPASQTLNALKLAFTNKGIQSKGDAYQLANQGYGEKRFTDSDLVGMHQVINNVFDPPNTANASKLLSGKNHLAQTWSKLPDTQTTPEASKKIINPPKTKEEAIAQNQAQFSSGGQ